MIAASKTNIVIREGVKMENNTFGSRLKALRLSKNLTQEKFANIFYLNKSSISKYEKDKNLPENQLLIKIADFFDVSVDYLLCKMCIRDSPYAVGHTIFIHMCKLLF